MNLARLIARVVFAFLPLVPVVSWAQECQQDQEINPATKSGITAAAREYLQFSAQGDFAALRTAIAPVAQSSLPAIERSIQQNRTVLGGTPSVQHVYSLTMPADAKQGEFLCGVFGSRGHTPNSASFVIPNLSPGQYAIVFQQVKSANETLSLALVLQQIANQWKIAGYYLKPAEVAGHDSAYFAALGQQAKQKGNSYLAWLYDYLAWDLTAPVNFVSTMVLDRLSSEMQSVTPVDIPVAGPVMFNTAGKQYRLTQVFPMVDGDKVTLIVKYQAATDMSNSAQLATDNIALIRATVAAHPELREQFQQVVARAVAQNGEDYGTVFPMKEIK